MLEINESKSFVTPVSTTRPHKLHPFPQLPSPSTVAHCTCPLGHGVLATPNGPRPHYPLSRAPHTMRAGWVSKSPLSHPQECWEPDATCHTVSSLQALLVLLSQALRRIMANVLSTDVFSTAIFPGPCDSLSLTLNGVLLVLNIRYNCLLPWHQLCINA